MFAFAGVCLQCTAPDYIQHIQYNFAPYPWSDFSIFKNEAAPSGIRLHVISPPPPPPPSLFVTWSIPAYPGTQRSLRATTSSPGATRRHEESILLTRLFHYASWSLVLGPSPFTHLFLRRGCFFSSPFSTLWIPDAADPFFSSSIRYINTWSWVPITGAEFPSPPPSTRVLFGVCQVEKRKGRFCLPNPSATIKSLFFARVHSRRLYGGCFKKQPAQCCVYWVLFQSCKVSPHCMAVLVKNGNTVWSGQRALHFMAEGAVGLSVWLFGWRSLGGGYAGIISMKRGWPALYKMAR